MTIALLQILYSTFFIDVMKHLRSMRICSPSYNLCYNDCLDVYVSDKTKLVLVVWWYFLPFPWFVDNQNGSDKTSCSCSMDCFSSTVRVRSIHVSSILLAKKSPFFLQSKNNLHILSISLMYPIFLDLYL